MTDTATFSVKAKNIDGINCEFILTDDSDDKLLIRAANLIIWLKDAGFEPYFPNTPKEAPAPVGVPANPPKGVDVKPKLAEEAVRQEHWCYEHNTEFFKKGAMRNYAHPVKDVHGDSIPGKWCNEEKKKEAA